MASGTSTSDSERLEALLAKGRAAWPTLFVDPGTFAQYLGERFENRSKLDDARVADLFLACACAR